MYSNPIDQLAALSGYVGHAEINADFELLGNSTTQDSGTMAELCGVLIGYLKVRQSSSNKVLSVSVVCRSFVYLTCATAYGYLLIQFSRNAKLAGTWPSLDSIVAEMNA